MAETLTFTLDTGDGAERNVVIKLRSDLAPNHVKQITDLFKLMHRLGEELILHLHQNL